ncbi:hypothetical protein SVAN01_04351 [Stagonosporopsis vannaccii]|nr:hypothetical protein SVAN01_04351 [Stagonosporopsis vannaccii]
MTERIHNLLQGMDNIAAAPTALISLLTQPAPPTHPTQSPADLTPPKLHPRKRSLTLPLSADQPSKSKWFPKPAQLHQRTLPQQQSALMRLPAELRALIWSHVVLGERERGAIALRWRGTGGGRGRASAFTVVPVRGGREHRGLGVLGMLRSCRLIYSEAIALLYSLPVFRFSNQNVETFFAFVCALPPHRREGIRCLDLEWLGWFCWGAPGGEDTKMVRRPPMWSYKRIGDVRALSGLPDARTAPRVDGVVSSEWVIDEILKGMKGLRLGGVKRGHVSTGWFAQE